VHDDVEILLGRVFRHVGVGEFLGGRHCVGCGRIYATDRVRWKKIEEREGRTTEC
jgi:hypothetical protein